MPNENIVAANTLLPTGIIKPVATDTEGVPTISNAAMQKIADDVLAAASTR